MTMARQWRRGDRQSPDRGDSTCAFYWNRHEQTKDTIAGHWIRTGDKYHQDEDGFYWFAGRSDDMLKVGGIWVSPAELEHTMLEHPAVQACGVVGRPDHDALIKPIAYVVLKAGTTASAELSADLQRFARERLAEYKRPAGSSSSSHFRRRRRERFSDSSFASVPSVSLGNAYRRLVARVGARSDSSTVHSSNSPGWQSSSRHKASSVENRIARALFVFSTDRFAIVMPMRSARSVSDSRRSRRM